MGYAIIPDPNRPAPPYTPGAAYSNDGLYTEHNHSFEADPRFKRAMAAVHYANRVNTHETNHPWRIHTALTVASWAANVPGDFVECGVWHGGTSAGIMEYLNWEDEKRTFTLYDTWEGIVDGDLNEAERRDTHRVALMNLYTDIYKTVQATFAKYPNVRLVRGRIPETLHKFAHPEVAYLHLDMNTAAPEKAALEFFWPRVVKGGMILLDDYGWLPEQRKVHNAFAEQVGADILTLVTGQGLIVKNCDG